MTLCLVLHELPEGGPETLEAAVWELSESHMMLGGGMLVETSVSARYLLAHLDRALRRATQQGSLVVTEVTDELYAAGLGPDAADWVRGVLEQAAG
ncbi:hypothetical protein [Roseomonas indoligenes]|uniref:Uncharacterized protein n=1 Tax=Roseomonas indoligenes TaxID=2820811 RepID=A0A940N131_9PROT|nr:hypothetical protein [Pararoseomonas indoligenes]MBP0494775.1 hypothetical protein [Pararoseomonas indoligenes]